MALMYRRRRRALVVLAFIAALSHTARAAGKPDVVDYFKLYYQQQVVKGLGAGALGFLHNAVADHEGPEQVLKPGTARSVIVDRRNGYLQINDGSDTDQIVTMAIYRKADGSKLIVVGSSDCADGCSFEVEFFAPAGDHLEAVPRGRVVPAIGPSQFIKAGRSMPGALAGIEPAVNYIPARVGTTLTLKPWYGYEMEERMEEHKDAATRNAIEDVRLRWDRNKGVFVAAPRQ
jgi:hypothetical protein